MPFCKEVLSLKYQIDVPRASAVPQEVNFYITERTLCQSSGM